MHRGIVRDACILAFSLLLPVAAAAALPCVGDCDGHGAVRNHGLIVAAARLLAMLPVPTPLGAAIANEVSE